jgi:tRNA threonylcarbamoyladenosine biosynthesis protein TsaB
MLILSIDTSGRNGSIALARTPDSPAEEIEAIETIPLTGGTFSAQLVPQIAALLASHGFTKFNIDAFSVASGPGSFTGLRIGLAAVKGLAEILRKPVAAVSLLELCVFVSGVQGKVMAALDAGRGYVYVGEYEVFSERIRSPREHMLGSAEFISQARGWTVVTPDPALAEAAAAAGLSVAKLAPLTAVEVAALGWQKILSGDTLTPDQLEANYIRRTDAEMLERIGP